MMKMVVRNGRRREPRAQERPAARWSACILIVFNILFFNVRSLSAHLSDLFDASSKAVPVMTTVRAPR